VDPITHGMIGVLIGHAAGDATPGRRALWAAAAMAPDLDALAAVAGRTAYLEYHRAALHGLAPAAALAIVTGFMAARAGVGNWRRCAAIAGVAVVSHLGLDGATSFGTALLFPFSPRMTNWDLLFAVDIGVSALLLFFVGASWAAAARRTSWARAGLAALALYAAVAGLCRGAVASSIRTEQASGHLPAGIVSVLPQPVWIASWAAFVDTGHGIWAGPVSLGARRPRLEAHPNPVPDALFETARAASAAVRFLSFARFPAVARTVNAVGTTFDFQDLRFAISGWERSNRWFGARVVLAPDGSVRSAGYSNP
jgi:inner membrane protein